MLILLIYTNPPKLSLLRNNENLEEMSPEGEKFSFFCLKAIDKMLAKRSIMLSDLSYIAVEKSKDLSAISINQAVGLSTADGLSFAQSLPLIEFEEAATLLKNLKK